jgi:hypothetical protein
MPVGHDQIDLRCASCAQILQQAYPSLFAFLRTRSQRENLFVSFQIHSQSGQDDRGIGFVSMANAEMHTIQVQDTPMALQRALSPSFKLVGETLVEATDRAGAGSDAHQGVGDFSYLMGTRSGHEHLRQPFCNMGLIATVALKGLRVKLSFTIVFAP